MTSKTDPETNTALQKEFEVQWYKKSTEETLKEFNTTREGLTTEESKQRLEKYGENKLPAKKPPTIWEIIFSQIKNPLIYILIIAGILSLAIGDFKDSIFIFLVILINTTIGTIQEWKAEKSSESLQKLLKIIVKVKRDKNETSINSDYLVPGDIVLLESGNKVPADMRILSANNLKVDESLLTGESTSVEKDSEKLEEDLELGDRSNMLFAGAVIMTGRATGVITSTGTKTEIGKIAKSVASLEVSKPPLVIRMEEFSKHVAIFVLIAGMLLAVIQYFQGENLIDIFFLVTAFAVSAIPEGLPAAVTVALSIGMHRMSKRNVIIKKLTAVEGLGSCTCIASDKTGTLTVNKQTAQVVRLSNHKEYKITGEGYNAEGDFYIKENEEDRKVSIDVDLDLDELAKTCALSNEADLYKDQDGNWQSQGDAIDIALLAMGNKLGFNTRTYKEEVEIRDEIPYESENKYSAIFYKENNKVKIGVKGALEALLPMCTHMLTEQGRVDIDESYLQQELEDLASKGYRIIAAATGEIEERPESQHYTIEDIKDLTFLGLIGLIDPLRPEAIEAVDKCHHAGIKVLMVTGDHPTTALAIGKQLGIASEKKDIVTGKEIAELEDEKLDEVVNQATIFARVAPLEKLKIVESLVRIGHYVAVTGDGVNDAPALRKANINVAMGSGTDIAKDISAIIVTDDNFASIVSGVEEGRFTYDNIRKVTYLLISTGIAEIILIALSLLFGLPIPLVAVQLLWLNLVTNGIQDVALAFEAGEKGAMDRQPRNTQEAIFNKLMLKQSLVSGFTMSIIAFITWYWLMHNNWNEGEARNIILLLMVLFENVHVFNCRSEITSTFKTPISNNYILIGGVILAQGIHIASMYIPVMQEILSVEPVGFDTWFYLLLMALSLLIVMEIFKLINFKVLKNKQFSTH
jgi:magnesium-transporting ATPase (P-type)